MSAPRRVIVEFDTPPAVVLRAQRARAAATPRRLDRFRADLASLRERAERDAGRPLSAEITNAYSQVFSGAAATLSPALLERVRRLPYVRRVVRDDTVRATLSDFASELDLPRLLRIILERSVTLLKVTGGDLGIYDEQTQELLIVASYNLERNYAGIRLKLGEGAAGGGTCRGQHRGVAEGHREG